MKSLTLTLVLATAALVVLASSVYGHHQPDHHDPVVADDLVSRIRTAMESAEIVPDVVGKAPSQLIKVKYSSSPYLSLCELFIEFDPLIIALRTCRSFCSSPHPHR